MRSLAKAAALFTVLAAGPALVWAQAAALPPARRSLWSIFLEGLEWPAFFILAGSFAMIAIVVEHFITVRRVNIAPPEQVRRARQLIEVRKFRECLEALRKSETFFARLMTTALQHGRHGFDAMHEAAVEKSAELSGRMFRKVEFMNIIGNLGPLLGLLGTVWGMIIAFKDLGGGGGAANAGELARGISLALVNTLLGLALAIVGLGFFGWCRNRVDSFTVAATVEVLDLLEYFRPLPIGTEPRGATAPASAPSLSAPPAPGVPGAEPAVVAAAAPRRP
jgi:biopolymer transport protein ExbB